MHCPCLGRIESNIRKDDLKKIKFQATSNTINSKFNRQIHVKSLFYTKQELLQRKLEMQNFRNYFYQGDYKQYDVIT